MIGSFEVLNKFEGAFNSDDELYLTTIASNISVSIENYLLHEKINILQKDAEKLYDTFYDTQKKIVSETKLSTVTEIQDFLNEIRQYDAFPKLLNKLKENSNQGQEIILLSEKISDSQKKLFTRIDQYLKQLKDQV